ncbi:MAG: DUF1684 domain-containing protein, partial [Angustibacter sp.]
MSTSPDPVVTALAVADWRRRVHDLYRAVRQTADPAEGHARWVSGRDELFASHPATPLLPEHRERFRGLVVRDYDPRYRFEVPIERADDGADAFTATTGTDGEVPYERLGRVHLQAPDGEVPLDVWRLASYGGGLFVPVRDATCGGTAYGGGRYVLDTVKGADLGPGSAAGTLVVDLNFAFNPSCAYDPMWACPPGPAREHERGDPNPWGDPNPAEGPRRIKPPP